MISVRISRNAKGHICGFTVKDHGDAGIVCPAVSLLTLNTANSLEVLTDGPLACEYDPEGGFLQVKLPHIAEGCECPKAGLLLEAMALGLRSVKESYSDQIEIEDDGYD